MTVMHAHLAAFEVLVREGLHDPVDLLRLARQPEGLERDAYRHVERQLPEVEGIQKRRQVRLVRAQLM